MAEDISAATGCPIITEPNLRERKLGIFEGLTLAEVRERHPAAYDGHMTRDPKFVIPEGESLEAKHHRVTQAMLTIAQRHLGQRIVIVTHGGVVDSAFRMAVGLTLHFPRVWTLYNASLNTITFQNDAWMLGTWGEISHLSRTDTPNYY
jgi:probable phosphoglycerate mutase